MVLYNLIGNNGITNLDVLRIDVFASILYYYKKKNIIEITDKKFILNIITFALDLVDSSDLLGEKDIKLIKQCYNLLILEILGEKEPQLLYLVYESIFNISNLDNIYKFNEKIIKDGLSLKFMKLNLEDANTIEIILRILNNNLNEPKEYSNIIYNNNIIEYYNNVLMKFDDNYAIIKNVLLELSYISKGCYNNIIKDNIIWEQQNYQKYFNLNNELILYYIKIINDLCNNYNDDIFQFIFNSNIFEYYIIFYCIII